jgi:HD-GYP domain-containing protein (c-di-GMP phosphodiesterase class II)
MPGSQQHKTLSQLLFLLAMLVPVAVAGFLLEPTLVFFHFYFLPVVALGYWLGFRAAVSGAMLCVLVVALQLLLVPEAFRVPSTRSDLLFYLGGWAGFLILCGAVVGYHRDKLAAKTLETAALVAELKKSNESIIMTQHATVLGLAKLAEFRDDDTGLHLDRIKEYCAVLATELGEQPAYKGYITATYVEDLSLSSVLHDIGKVGIPDSVLQKPGSLTPQEWTVMQKHAELGAATLRSIQANVEGRSFLTLGIELAHHHHERWDGKGYPNGLLAENIPLAARIVGVADTYDAITSQRVYSKRRSHAEAMAIILEESGKQFDPMVVEAFRKTENQFNVVRTSFHG